MDEQERDFLLPTYIYVDTFIIDECKKPCRLKKGCLRPPPHPKMSILVRFFVFLISSACDRAWC